MTSPLSTRPLVAGGLLLLVVAGCRTLVGIEDLENGFGPPGEPAGRSDGGGARGPDSGFSPADQAAIDACSVELSCPICCKERFGVGLAFEAAGSAGKACACEACGADCAAECADAGADLAGPPDAAAGGGACIRCVDTELTRRPARACIAPACGDNERCQTGLACIRACGPS